jgi:hypothetical protein
VNSIVELRQTAENEWKAKYQGNYGLYTIKITIDGKKTVKFSCSCPSDYYPCKHISIIENAIAEKIADNSKSLKHDKIKVQDLIANVSAEKLREFIITQAKYNSELLNAVLLKFAANAENKNGNKYSEIIRRALNSVSVEEDHYYTEESQSIDVLDQWLDKAKDCIRLKQYDEAIFICKAYVEEYSRWLYDAREDIAYLFHSEYQSTPFEIMENAAKHTDKKKLFDYCLSEMEKKKYKKTEFYNNFHRLLASLALKVDPDTFIALQDELLAEIQDKSSYEFKVILRRKIDFFRQLGKADKAWALIEENIQIESFREEVVKNRIDRQNFSEAKKLINDFFESQKKGDNRYFHDTWYELLLEIAQKEKDIPVIRNLAYGFIERYFDKKYFEIYKAAFSPAEWADERGKLLLHYKRKNNYFGRDSAAELLVTEKETGLLIDHVEKHLSMQSLKKYYSVFASVYPERTLELFQKVLISYTEENVGRSHYEEILVMLKKMSRIKGGRKAAMDLAAGFMAQYKNRRAMMEVLKLFCQKNNNNPGV